jgi:hypothetical protein
VTWLCWKISHLAEDILLSWATNPDSYSSLADGLTRAVGPPVRFSRLAHSGGNRAQERRSDRATIGARKPTALLRGYRIGSRQDGLQVDGALEVLCQPSIAPDPREEPLDNPASRFTAKPDPASHLMTSSAVASNFGGIVMPSAAIPLEALGNRLVVGYKSTTG